MVVIIKKATSVYRSCRAGYGDGCTIRYAPVRSTKRVDSATKVICTIATEGRVSEVGTGDAELAIDLLNVMTAGAVGATIVNCQ